MDQQFEKSEGVSPMTDLDVLVRVMPTPNPQALKFVSNHPFKREGKSTFNSAGEALGLTLIEDLFSLRGVLQIHAFENVLTVTFEEGEDPVSARDSVVSIIKTRMAVHNPDFVLEGEKAKDRSHLSPDVLRIEEILDRTIRPGLQGDGGDVEVVQFDPESKTVEILYQGACGTCPSSMFGTLEAIRGILQDEFDPEVDVTIADSVFPY